MKMFFQGVEGKELQVILSLFSLSLLVFVCALLVCSASQVLSQSSFYALLCLTCFCLIIFQFCFILFFHIKIKKKFEKSEKYKNIVCFVYIGTCVPWMAIETKFSKLCIFYNLDEHLYT